MENLTEKVKKLQEVMPECTFIQEGSAIRIKKHYHTSEFHGVVDHSLDVLFRSISDLDKEIRGQCRLEQQYQEYQNRYEGDESFAERAHDGQHLNMAVSKQRVLKDIKAFLETGKTITQKNKEIEEEKAKKRKEIADSLKVVTGLRMSGTDWKNNIKKKNIDLEFVDEDFNDPNMERLLKEFDKAINPYENPDKKVIREFETCDKELGTFKSKTLNGVSVERTMKNPEGKRFLDDYYLNTMGLVYSVTFGNNTISHCHIATSKAGGYGRTKHTNFYENIEEVDKRKFITYCAKEKEKIDSFWGTSKVDCKRIATLKSVLRKAILAAKTITDPMCE
ncbi:MAG: hypothetical protein LBO09_07395 [Candidatus Peribacteria bacterium]|jgi:hypothetical protein|nr:hypothetical protein [Candidatus Peribacteria bacterium]